MDLLLQHIKFFTVMPEGVTQPVFGSTGQPTNQGEGLQMDTPSGDPMDFDLLAEYLLDDTNANAVTFDFK